MPLKIAMIGAGSIGFTRRLIQDMLAVPELQDTTFALTDLVEKNLRMVEQLCVRDIKGNDLPAQVLATTDRRAAIADADYVFCTIRQGGWKHFNMTSKFRCGMASTNVSATLSVRGASCMGSGQFRRCWIFCRDIREVAKPGALFFNYSNPMAMNTWACNQYGGIPTIGLCHGVQGAHRQLAACVEQWARREGLLPMDATVDVNEVEIVGAGLNHQTWFIKVNWRGHDMLPHLLAEFRAHPEFSKTEKVRIDVLERFGFYSTESNGHLSEYLPWYRKRPHEINRWIDLSSWIHGETGGYLRVCREGRSWFETDFPNWLQEPIQNVGPGNRSEEHGSYIVEALLTGRTYRGHFNIPNRGHISNLPDDTIIEIPGYVDRTGINMPLVGPLPLACAATCAVSARVQQMAVEAAVRGDVMLLKQAMLHDPLVGAVCNPEEVWQMTDEMLVALAPWLPQYVSEIPKAAERLLQHEKNGTRVNLQKGRGAARLETKSVAEMALRAAESRKNAAAADKGQMTKSPS